MHVTPFVVFVIYYATLSDTRLIKKNPETTTVSLKTSKVHPVRLTRDVYDEEALIEISKEDERQRDEGTGLYEKLSKSKLRHKTSKTLRHTRVSRASNENLEEIVRNETQSLPKEEKKVLVKKHIPKFKEMDYDDDYQIRINTRPIRFADSSEHEDEDFNVDDYEFDVNHDEFSGRGKPLEPRTKLNLTKSKNKKADPKPKITPPPPEIKLRNNVIIPPIETTKKEKKIKKSVDKIERLKEDYYDDIISTSTKAPEKEKERGDSEQSDENEESGEFELSSVGKSKFWTMRFVPIIPEDTTTIDENNLSNANEPKVS